MAAHLLRTGELDNLSTQVATLDGTKVLEEEEVVRVMSVKEEATPTCWLLLRLQASLYTI